MDIRKNSSMDIINEARRYAKSLKYNNRSSDIRIAVIGSSSIQYFVMTLQYILYIDGINASFYEGEFNGITMDVFDDNSPLYSFNPNIVIIITHYTDIKSFPTLLDDKKNIYDLANENMQYYKNIWKNLSRIDGVQVLQSNFVIPPHHILGNLETELQFSNTNYYRLLNNILYSQKGKNVTIIDLDLQADYIGKYQWFDYSAFFLNKMGCKLEYLPSIAECFKRQINAILGKVRKCLVLDLDNTLWGGIVGDDGWQGIQLDPNNAIGESYRYFQSYLLQLKNRGVILAVCSKNDEINAKEPFVKNKNMILHLNDISSFVANWDDKATNLRRIAKELNIGIDSLVFFDDNPAEREIIKSYLPEVHVVDVPTDPALYTIQLDKESPFEWSQITKEDILRNNSYVENKKRIEMQTQFVNYDEYLEALEMKGISRLLNETESGRFIQLLNKSNQFNLRTVRYSESEINKMLNSDNYKCIYVDLKDKFSEYGIISCVVLKRREHICFIESWVMSCRVLKRGVEYFMFTRIVEEAKKMGCNEILSEYIPTEKNSMVENFYDSLGFIFESMNNGIKCYRYDLNKDYINKNSHILSLNN